MSCRYDGESFLMNSDERRLHGHCSHAASHAMEFHKQDMIGNESSRLVDSEYSEDILQHAMQMEIETLPDVTLIDMQREIQWYMRPFLIDFLVEAHAAFALLPETIYLTVNLLDRYCAKRVVYKQHYQLVGCAALLIAAKYGDRKERVPQIDELNSMCCGLYDAGMFTQMEMHVLNTLDWTIGHPTVDFFWRSSVANTCDDGEVQQMAGYLSEIALYHRDFVSTRPSTLARSSLALARIVLNRLEVYDGPWDHTERQTLLNLFQHLNEPSPTLARKYSSHRMFGVSTTLAGFMAEQAAAAAEAARRRAPPSPPMPRVSLPGDIYSTPQKGHGTMEDIEGYMTPPITPDNVFFANECQNIMKEGYTMRPCRPVTPTLPQQQQYGGYSQGGAYMAFEAQAQRCRMLSRHRNHTHH